jgi:O-antigen/teichoic acid export membrane protein
MAVATVVQVVIGLVGDIGLRQAIIQSKNGGNQTFLNTAWTVQVLRGCFIWISCLCIALALQLLNSNGWFPHESVYGNPVLPAIIAATSSSSVILGFQSIKLISMSRGLDLRRVTLIELIQMACGLTIAIVFAWLTHSVWSFVASGLVGSAITTLLSRFWLPGENDSFAWDREALKELLRFGRWILLSSLIGVLAMNGDRLLLGGWVTAAVLGYYSIAINLSSVVDGIGARIFGNVSLPALGEIARKQPERFSALFSRMRLSADACYVGMAGFLFATGPGIVALLYDPRYLAAGSMLQLLSFSLLFSRYGLAQDAYLALGKPNYIAAINVTKVISIFVLVPAMYHLYGVQGAIAGISFCLLPTLPLVFWFNRKLRLNNFWLEFLMLGMWPVGWCAGKAILAVMLYVR